MGKPLLGAVVTKPRKQHVYEPIPVLNLVRVTRAEIDARRNKAYTYLIP